MQRKFSIIGVGNPDRGDDAIGLIVADKLTHMVTDRLHVVKSTGDISQLLKYFEAVDAVIIVDASCSSVEPGTVKRFDIHHAPLPQVVDNLSSHGMGLGEALELARSMDLLPASCVVYTIEGDNYEMGGQVSSRVEAAVESVVNLVLNEIEANSETGVMHA